MNFTKMEGLGNDYIYFNCLESDIHNPDKLAIAISDRHFGVGSDGIVMICNPSIPNADFRMRMFNNDGSEAENCGNALRCVGKYLFDKGIHKNNSVSIETKAGIKKLEFLTENNKVKKVRVNMGAPILKSQDIPISSTEDTYINRDFEIEGFSGQVSCVSMGNPHAVFFVNKITDELVLGIGPKIEVHPFFPKKVNVEFVEVLSRDKLKMRVWERGSGETLACGTGACAVAVSAILNGFADRKVTIQLLGGDLDIEWSEADNCVYQFGPAKFVCEGTYEF